jgi:serine protease Do
MSGTTPGGEWLPSNKRSFESQVNPASGARQQSPPPAAPSLPPVALEHAPSSISSPIGSAGPAQPRRTFSALLAAVLAAGTIGSIGGSALTAASLHRGALVVQTASAAPPVAASTSASAAIADTSGLKAVYKQVSPAVVSVETAISATQNRATGQSPRSIPGAPNVPGFQGTPSNPSSPSNPTNPRQGPSFQATGEGTGFIVDGDGNVLTNNHVIEGAGRVTVVLADGTRLPAQVVGADPGNDVALIRASLPAGKTAVATLGDSDAVEPGDTAIAIGTPFGLDHTLTAGIISAVNRDFGSAAGRPMRGLIQTDAAINPGNSGGPLLNASGEVIGITTSIESPVRANVGVGFAIPINQVKQLLAQLKGGQMVQHAWLGISGIAVSSDQAGDLGLPSSITQGVAVVQVAPNSPAAQAGLRGAGGTSSSQPGDVIVAVDGRPVNRVQDVGSYLDTKKPGDVITLTIIRDGARQDLRATLAPWPAGQDS